jgi:glycosyltransferase involved in cell wall biosynthesis
VLTSTRASLEYLPRIAWWFDRLTARWCQRIVAVSQGTAAFVVQQERIPESKVVIVPNGVDLQHYRPGDHAAARLRWAIPKGGFVIASIGRLHPQKGHRFLLEALASIRSDIAGIVCLIAGEGQLREELIQYATVLGVADCCRFLGAVPDTRSIYDVADVAVLASLYEGMPNVVLEAMAMACPVVATRVQGSSDLVRPGETGLLVPPGDSLALAEGLRELAADPSRRRAMGARSRSLAEAHHGIDKMVASVEALYLREWRLSAMASQSWFDDEPRR